MAERLTAVPGCVRPMTETDLGIVLAWRNHEGIRQYMFNAKTVTEEEHRRWFERAAADPGRALLVFEREGQPAGFAHFSSGPHPRVADWGFYAAPGAPKGTGRALGHAALRHAFDELALHKVCGLVMGSNTRSVNLHLGLGFAQEGLLREHHFDGSGYQDVLCFGLLSREWRVRWKD
jgi:UDP-4-amino-4,6-dideoxy-N-acetyl-beta-L-altrosamine N-acetyltransferase